MLSTPKPRDRASSIISIAIPEFDANALPRTKTIVDSEQKSNSESLSSICDSSASRENTSMSFYHSFSSDPSNKTRTSIAQTKDKAVQEFLEYMVRPKYTKSASRLYLGSHFDYDARMSVAVIGSRNSGKEVILRKELGLADGILELEKNIQIASKIYSGRLSTLVEYWVAPDSKIYMIKSIKCLSGHAGTIFVFDVTDPLSLKYLLPAIEIMKTSMAATSSGQAQPYGHFGILLANKIDQPGLRVVFEEEATAFAKEHNLLYLETCPSEEVKKINKLFSDILLKAFLQVPETMNHINRDLGIARGTTPIGLQLGLALDPWNKFKYKEKLKKEKMISDATKSVDWLSDLKEFNMMIENSTDFQDSIHSVSIIVD